MKAIQLIKHGNDPSCFEVKEMAKPVPKAGEVCIRVEAFGLNYADVMARKGLYRDAPPLPSVLGYDVVGKIESVGDGVDKSWIDKRVVAVTEFGGYAEYTITKADGVAELPFDLPHHAATALVTQYATAYYAAFQCANIREGDTVFIHAAAGGVGLALIQFCKLRNCTIYGSVSSSEKEEVIRKMGVHHVINTSTQNIFVELQKLNQQLDVIFDSVGGKGVKLGIKSLRAGGRMVCYGGAQLTENTNIFSKLGFVFSFGFYSPITLLASSKSLIGINMLKLIRSKPADMKLMLDDIIKLLKEKKMIEPIGKTFSVSEVFDAHRFLESRKSIGKIAVRW